MKGYFIFGAFRNLLGIGMLTLLTYFSVPLTLALLMTVSIGCALYVLQVKHFVGDIQVLTILKVFASIFILNRAMLWLLYEQLQIPIYFSQAISIVVLTTSSFLYLRWKKNAD
jgi:putative flippase GtrA